MFKLLNFFKFFIRIKFISILLNINVIFCFLYDFFFILLKRFFKNQN